VTLTLHKIELYNFRCHEHFVFTPDLEGITAISGQNGSGKSTIVDAFAWALYGTRPSKVTNKMLIRDGVSIKDAEVKVIIDISINKIDYRIIRRIVSDSGATDCNVYGRSGEADYSVLAGPAVSSAETYIKQIMGMDEKGFLTSILIQQKQVDQIVSSTPRERAAVIEKLTGISSITEAIDLSRAETKAYQKAANVITVKDSDSIRKEIEDIISQAKYLKLKISNETGELKKKSSLIDRMTAQLELDTNNYNKNEELINQKNLINQHSKMLNDELKRITSELEKFKRSNSSTVVVDPKPLKAQYDRELSKFLNLKNDVDVLKNSIDANTKLVSENKELISSLDKVKEDLENHNIKLESYEHELAEQKDKYQAIQSNKKQTKKALSTISTGDMVCPICKRPIDNPEDLAKELNAEYDTLVKKESALKSDIKDKQSLIQSTTDEITKLTESVENISKIIDIKDALPDDKTLLSTKSATLSELKSRTDTMNKDYDKAIKQYLHREDLDNKKNRLSEINSELGTVHKELDDIEDAISKLHSIKKSELNARKKTADKTSNDYNSLLIEFNKDKSDYKYMQTRYKDLRVQYDDAVESKKKYETLTSQMKNSAVSTTVMSDFKIDRIKFAVPTIEMYASTILSQFTDSKFTQLKLDGKFNASVITSEGEERPIAQLSGGELSAAAIALRLSISMLLNGADKNVIIFDEVLVSMDEVRARKIMETISTVTNSQIVFIAHNSDIDSVADLVVQVGKDENQED
jgi:exonuclease SbcC